MLAMALPRRRWPWRDVVVESCWQWCWQGDVGHGVMSLLSYASDGVTETTLVVERCRCRVMLAMTL
jgi:hypothetical protein